MQLKLDRRFAKQAKGVFEKYEFRVGVLNDSVHKNAVSKNKGLKTYAGGPARKIGRSGSLTVSQVSERLRKSSGINFYTAPFSARKNKDILNFTKSFFDLCFGRTEKRRCENLLQAIVRNPILRGDYGQNNPKTARTKGFNRYMIDTAQLFKAITAKVVGRV
jgi:hypothetical protein